MANYYQPSGRFSPLSFPILLVISLTVIPILSAIYAYLTFYIPFIYINFLITIGLGFGVSFCINFLVIRFGKVRNVPLSFIIGLIGGFFALYWQWVFWVHIFIEGEIELLQLAINPLGMIDIIVEINNIGPWEMFGTRLSGIFLWIIWLIETIIIIGFPTISSPSSAKEPFDETANKWYDTINLPNFNYLPNTVVSEFENNNDKVFEMLEVNPVKDKDHSEFTLYSSEHSENYLSITNKKAKYNDDGKVDFEDIDLLTHLQISKEQKDKLLAFIK